MSSSSAINSAAATRRPQLSLSDRQAAARAQVVAKYGDAGAALYDALAQRNVGLVPSPRLEPLFDAAMQLAAGVNRGPEVRGVSRDAHLDQLVGKIADAASRNGGKLGEPAVAEIRQAFLATPNAQFETRFENQDAMDAALRTVGAMGAERAASRLAAPGAERQFTPGSLQRRAEALQQARTAPGGPKMDEMKTLLEEGYEIMRSDPEGVRTHGQAELSAFMAEADAASKIAGAQEDRSFWDIVLAVLTLGGTLIYDQFTTSDAERLDEAANRVLVRNSSMLHDPGQRTLNSISGLREQSDKTANDIIPGTTESWNWDRVVQLTDEMDDERFLQVTSGLSVNDRVRYAERYTGKQGMDAVNAFMEMGRDRLRGRDEFRFTRQFDINNVSGHLQAHHMIEMDVSGWWLLPDNDKAVHRLLQRMTSAQIRAVDLAMREPPPAGAGKPLEEVLKDLTGSDERKALFLASDAARVNGGAVSDAAVRAFDLHEAGPDDALRLLAGDPPNSQGLTPEEIRETAVAYHRANTMLWNDDREGHDGTSGDLRESTFAAMLHDKYEYFLGIGNKDSAIEAVNAALGGTKFMAREGEDPEAAYQREVQIRENSAQFIAHAIRFRGERNTQGDADIHWMLGMTQNQNVMPRPANGRPTPQEVFSNYTAAYRDAPPSQIFGDMYNAVGEDTKALIDITMVDGYGFYSPAASAIRLHQALTANFLTGGKREDVIYQILDRPDLSPAERKAWVEQIESEYARRYVDDGQPANLRADLEEELGGTIELQNGSTYPARALRLFDAGKKGETLTLGERLIYGIDKESLGGMHQDDVGRILEHAATIPFDQRRAVIQQAASDYQAATGTPLMDALDGLSGSAARRGQMVAVAVGGVSPNAIVDLTREMQNTGIGPAITKFMGFQNVGLAEDAMLEQANQSSSAMRAWVETEQNFAQNVKPRIEAGTISEDELTAEIEKLLQSRAVYQHHFGELVQRIQTHEERWAKSEHIASSIAMTITLAGTMAVWPGAPAWAMGLAGAAGKSALPLANGGDWLEVARTHAVPGFVAGSLAALGPKWVGQIQGLNESTTYMAAIVRGGFTGSIVGGGTNFARALARDPKALLSALEAGGKGVATGFAVGAITAAVVDGIRRIADKIKGDEGANNDNNVDDDGVDDDPVDDDPIDDDPVDDNPDTGRPDDNGGPDSGRPDEGGGPVSGRDGQGGTPNNTGNTNDGGAGAGQDAGGTPVDTNPDTTPADTNPNPNNGGRGDEGIVPGSGRSGLRVQQDASGLRVQQSRAGLDTQSGRPTEGAIPDSGRGTLPDRTGVDINTQTPVDNTPPVDNGGGVDIDFNPPTFTIPEPVLAPEMGVAQAAIQNSITTGAVDVLGTQEAFTPDSRPVVERSAPERPDPRNDDEARRRLDGGGGARLEGQQEEREERTTPSVQNADRAAAAAAEREAAAVAEREAAATAEREAAAAAEREAAATAEREAAAAAEREAAAAAEREAAAAAEREAAAAAEREAALAAEREAAAAAEREAAARIADISPAMPYGGSARYDALINAVEAQATQRRSTLRISAGKQGAVDSLADEFGTRLGEDIGNALGDRTIIRLAGEGDLVTRIRNQLVAANNRNPGSAHLEVSTLNRMAERIAEKVRAEATGSRSVFDQLIDGIEDGFGEHVSWGIFNANSDEGKETMRNLVRRAASRMDTEFLDEVSESQLSEAFYNQLKAANSRDGGFWSIKDENLRNAANVMAQEIRRMVREKE